MTWIVLPGMDGTGELLAPLVAQIPRGDVAVVVRYPKARVFTRRELLSHIEESLPLVGDYVLIAESFGGQFAIEIAARELPRLRALILVSTFATNPVGLLAKALLLAVGPAPFAIKPPALVVRHFLIGDSSLEMVTTVREAIGTVNSSVMASRLRMVLACDVERFARAIKAPTLVIGATQDRLIRRTVTERLASQIPATKLVWLNAPHLVLFTQPQEAFREMSKFLASSGSAQIER